MAVEFPALHDLPVKRDTALSMSQENSKTVRRAVDAMNRRDLKTLNTLFADDSEFRSRLAASEGRIFRGQEGIRHYFEFLDDAFEEYRCEVQKVIDAGEDRVVALLTFSARGRGSGVSLNQHFGLVLDFQGKQIARMDSYFTPAEAIEAAGLDE